MSEEKNTAAGTGHFVTMAEKIVNQNGVLIDNQKVRTLFFRPGRRPESHTGKSQSAGKSEGVSLDLEKRAVLAPLVIPLTTTLIISAALATNDFEKVHHDRDLAQSQGLKDIIMNILTSSGLAIRYVTDWAGPTAVIKGIFTQLKASNYPHDVMTLTGSADHKFRSGSPTTIVVSGKNSLGTHIESTITIT